MTSPLRLLAFALFLAPSLLPAAENQRFILERPYPVTEIPEPDRSLPVTNVILMIGDGMGIHHLSAAWAANRGRLFIENCPVTGISKTWCADKLVTDSAAAGTAMATGTKTLYHRVAVCPRGNKLDSLVDKAADMGKSTGVIATCELNDATPASFCANNEKRSDAYGIIGDYPRSRADFIFGGGGKYFTQRPDGRDIFQEMQAQGYRVARTWEEAGALPPGKTLAVTAPGNLPPPSKRGDVFRRATLKALDTLSRNPEGFFLMVEGSKVDWAAHANDPAGMIGEFLAFDKAVGAALDFAKKDGNTTVIILPDHGNSGFSIGRNGLKKSYTSLTLEDLFGTVSKITRTAEGLEKIMLNTKPEEIKNVFRQYTGIDITDQEMKTLAGSKNYKAEDYTSVSNSNNMTHNITVMLNERMPFGFTTGGHTGEEVFLAVYHPQGDILKGNVRNTDVHNYLYKVSGLQKPMKQLTSEIFAKHTDVFNGLKYSIVQGKDFPKLVVKNKRKND